MDIIYSPPLYLANTCAMENFAQVFMRLHKLGLVMSPSSTVRLLDELGSEHDKVVHQWREELLGTLQVLIMDHNLMCVS